MNTLKHYTYAIDYSKSKAQKHAVIVPQLFTSLTQAQKYNNDHIPKGIIKKITIVDMGTIE